MVDLLLKNAYIITPFMKIKNGFVAINRGKITFIGKDKEYNDYVQKKSLREINIQGKYLVPGFFDIHTHGGAGISHDKIDNVSQLVLDFFPEYNFSNLNSRKERLTIEHLLTMGSGLDWSETPIDDDLRRMAFSLDSIQFILDSYMAFEPGTGFEYNSGASHLLSAIIQQTTGNTTLEFAQKYLFI